MNVFVEAIRQLGLDVLHRRRRRDRKTQPRLARLAQQTFHAGTQGHVARGDHLGVQRVLGAVQTRDERITIPRHLERGQVFIEIPAYALFAARHLEQFSIEFHGPFPIETRPREGAIEGDAMAVQFGVGSVPSTSKINACNCILMNAPINRTKGQTASIFAAPAHCRRAGHIVSRDHAPPRRRAQTFLASTRGFWYRNELYSGRRVPMPATKKASAKPTPAKGVKKAVPAQATAKKVVSKPSAGSKSSVSKTGIAKTKVAKPTTTNHTSNRTSKPTMPAVTPKKTPASSRASAESLLTSFKNFEPYPIKKGEEYMNEKQIEHFRAILNAWKRELMEEVDRTMHYMQDEAANFPDPNDRASQESDFELELRARDRERKLI